MGLPKAGFQKEFSKGLSWPISIALICGLATRGHDVHQYKKAVGRLNPFKTRNSILRMRFDEALDLFPNGSCDFIYVDGYAHTGEEEGRTFRDWFPKLKSGGIFAGDDYSPEWPLVVREVDKFVAENNLKMFGY